MQRLSLGSATTTLAGQRLWLDILHTKMTQDVFQGAGSPDVNAPALSPLEQGTSRAQLVAEAIRAAILDGRLPPGSTLVERGLAEMLGVSKTPVREALIRLARSGLVTFGPTRRVRVRVISPAELHAIYEVRLLLEPWAAMRAAQVAPSAAADAAGSALIEADEVMDGAASVDLTLSNRRFHRALYSHCGNDLVRAMLDDLQDQVALGVVALWRSNPTWWDESQEHHAIIRAVVEGDAAGAGSLMRNHIEHALRRVDEAALRGVGTLG